MTEVVAGGETLTPSHVISSLPLRTTVGITEPEAPVEVRDAARGLRYREFLTVLLVIDGEDLFPDNWIYIHQPGVRVLRIQNFKSWSPWMVPNDTDASIGMEYFCFEGDELWNMADEELVELAAREIEQLGLAQRRARSSSASSMRVHKAYPIYDAEYAERVATIRGWLETIANLIQVGRNGLHRYNNSDHSMLTAMRAVDNILLGTTTTSGRSTPRASTTRSTSRTSSRTATRPTRPRWSSRSPRSGSDVEKRGSCSARHLRCCCARAAGRHPRPPTSATNPLVVRGCHKAQHDGHEHQHGAGRAAPTTSTSTSGGSSFSGRPRSRSRSARSSCSAASPSSSGATPAASAGAHAPRRRRPAPAPAAGPRPRASRASSARPSGGGASAGGRSSARRPTSTAIPRSPRLARNSWRSTVRSLQCTWAAISR